MVEIITLHPPCRMLAEPVRDPDTQHMLAAELMYFHGAPLAHVVAYEERLRARRKADHMRQVERRMGSRRRHL